MSQPKILIVDDEDVLRELFARTLLRENYVVFQAESGKKAIALAQSESPDLVILDLYLPDLGGLEVLEQIARSNPSSSVVMMTGHGEIATAVQAMKLGAADYLLKPFQSEYLKSTVRSLLARSPGQQPDIPFRRVIGESPRIREVWNQISRYAFSDISILLLGESGTGKELFARAIRERSKRRDKPFIALDCASLPDTLVESEIFGHEKGAFTGALDRRIGRFELAQGGTLFLDEIGNLPPLVQAKLLRVVQERYIERLGGGKPIPVDVRIVSATNLDLEQAIRRGSFREDLYYRLAEVTVALPPLRERQGDLDVLVDYFVMEFNRRFGRSVRGVSDKAWEELRAYRWPGNVRELENVIKSSLLAADEYILPENLPDYLHREPAASLPAASRADAMRERLRERIEEGLSAGSLRLRELVAQFTEEIERETLAELLNHRHFTQVELAEFLDVDPKTLRTKLQKFGLRTR